MALKFKSAVIDAAISDNSKTVVYSVLTVCLCVVVAYIIVVVILLFKDGYRMWEDNNHNLNVATVAAIVCGSIATVIIRAAPYIRYPVINAINKIPNSLNNLMDSGNTPYFNPPVYDFRHGQYIRTDDVPYEMDRYGLPIVNEFVPLNSFNTALFRRYHKADLIEYEIVKDTLGSAYKDAKAYVHLMEAMRAIHTPSEPSELAIYRHVDTVVDTISGILRVQTIGDQCLIVRTIGNSHALVHKNRYAQFITDPAVSSEMQLFNKYKLLKHFKETKKLKGLSWLVGKVFTNTESSRIDTFNQYYRVYEELRIMYTLLAGDASYSDKGKNIADLTNALVELLMEDETLGLMHIIDSMVPVACINRCITASNNLIIDVGEYLAKQPSMNMEQFYRRVLEQSPSIRLSTILEDVYEDKHVLSICRSIYDLKKATVIDALSASSPKIDINAVQIDFLLPYLGKYGLAEVANAHNRVIDRVRNTMGAVVDRVNSVRDAAIVDKLLRIGSLGQSNVKEWASQMKTTLVREPSAVITSARKLREAIARRIAERTSIIDMHTTAQDEPSSVVPELLELEAKNTEEAALIAQIDERLDTLSAIATSSEPTTAAISISLEHPPLTSAVPNQLAAAMDMQLVSSVPTTDDNLQTLSSIFSFARNVSDMASDTADVGAEVDSVKGDIISLIQQNADLINAIAEEETAGTQEEQSVLDNLVSMVEQAVVHEEAKTTSGVELADTGRIVLTQLIDTTKETYNKTRAEVEALYGAHAETADEANPIQTAMSDVSTAYASLMSDMHELDHLSKANSGDVEGVKALMDKIREENDRVAQLLHDLNTIKQVEETKLLEQIRKDHIEEASARQLSSVVVGDVLAQGQMSVMAKKHQLDIKALEAQREQQSQVLDDSQRQMRELEDRLRIAEERLQEAVDASSKTTDKMAVELVATKEKLLESQSSMAILEGQKLSLDAEMRRVKEEMSSMYAQFDADISAIASGPMIASNVSQAKDALVQDISQERQMHDSMMHNINARILSLMEEQRQAMEETYAENLRQQIEEQRKFAIDTQTAFDDKIRKSIMAFKVSIIRGIGTTVDIGIGDDSSLEDCLAKITDYIGQNQGRISTMSERIVMLEDKEAALLLDKDHVDSELAQVKQAYTEDRQAWEDTKRTMIAESEQAKQQSEGTKQDLQKQLADAKDRLEQTTRQMETDIAPLQVSNQELSNQRRMLQETIAVLEKQNQLLDTRVRDMAEQSAASSPQLEQRIAEVASLNQQMQAMKAKYDKNVQEYADLRDQLKSAEAETVRLEKQLAEQGETFAKQLASQNVQSRKDISECLGIGGEYKGKKMERLYQLTNVVKSDGVPILNAPKITSELVNAMNAFISTILGGKHPENADTDPVLKKIHWMEPRIISLFPN